MKYIDMQIKRRKRGLLNAGYFQWEYPKVCVNLQTDVR